MRKEEFSFRNRHDLKLIGEVWHPHQTKGLAFVHHGLSGSIAQPHITRMAETFIAHDYTTVVFDGTHSFGASEGSLEHSTLTKHWQDLEDVLLWSQHKDFYQEPFILAGHSMGGFSVLYVGMKHLDKVKALAPFSATISGKLLEKRSRETDLAGHLTWQEQGYKIKQHRTDPDIQGKVSWQLITDAQNYDLLTMVEKITCPVLLVVGENDDGTPPEDQRKLYDVLSGPKELVVIPNCGHTFRAPHELQAMEAALDTWLTQLA